MQQLFAFTLVLALSLNFVNAQKKKGKKGTSSTFQPPATTTSEGQVTIDGKTINYSVEAGYISLQSDYGKKKAHLFYIAYTKKGVDNTKERPVTFSFNGGPGSSSVWLHLGMLGPRKVKMSGKGTPPPPPYELTNNSQSWLDKSDLVFIDPVSTGYSRAHKKKKAKKYHSYKKDIQSVGKFIRRYLNDNARWGSPKYIIGESYGTTRAAGLSNHLIENYGIYLNGIIMVSFVNNFKTISFTPGNDLPYTLFLPSYTATAWYHNQLPSSLQQQSLSQVLEEVEKFANNKYPIALRKGQQMDPSTQQQLTDKLHQYTGLPKTYIRQSNWRINSGQFRKELLKDSLQVVGRFDSRYKGKELDALKKHAGKDPSYHSVAHAPFSTLINDYLTREIGFDTKIVYEVLSRDVHPWNFQPYVNRYVNVAPQLKKAITKNPQMKVWIASGYYDLATPYFATQYTINHMRLPNKLQQNITMSHHKAGHMMYLHPPSLKEMKQQATQFFNNAN